GKPAPWDLVEAGAGRGILMRDLLAALERERPDAARAARPAIVEVSPRMRAQQSLALEGRDLRWASVAHNLAPIRGVVFANEVLDAFPVHVLSRTADGVREVFVGEAAGTLVETLRAPGSADLRWRIPEAVPVGGRWAALRRCGNAARGAARARHSRDRRARGDADRSAPRREPAVGGR